MTLSPAYLIQFGRPGFVGRFHSATSLARGERVVVRGVRGTELGEVLLPVAGMGEDGEAIRAATHDDESHATQANEHAQELLTAASEAATAASLPLVFVDVEATLDGMAILHALPWDQCDVTPLLEELSSRFGFQVRLLDLSRSPTVKDEPSQGGCGKPGCGTESGGGCSTGGGCSSGSCSRGSVKSSDELTEHFADLRRKMEAAGFTRTPLN